MEHLICLICYTAHMKLFVISDIHGYPAALKKALTAFDASGAGALLIAGDYMYHGPRNGVHEGYDGPAVAELLNAYKDRIIGIRGNCDSEVDQMLLGFPMLAPYTRQLLADGTSLFMHHGHTLSEEQIASWCAEGSIVISGHTHVAVLEQRDGRIFLNPGSVSLPKGESKAGYAVIDTNAGCISLCELETGEPYSTLSIRLP